MKKIICGLSIFVIICSFCFSKTVNDAQIIPSDSWIYDDFLELQSRNKLFVFVQNTPVCVGELKFYLKEFDYDRMDEYSKLIYDRLYDSLYEKDDITTIPGVQFSMHPQLNLEGYYKTNKDLPWSFNYYFRDNLISMPIDLGFGNNLALGADFFFGKSYIAAARNDNFWNVPIDKNHTQIHKLSEFYFPVFAYTGFGQYFENWGYNFHVGKQGKTIGNTLSGSIIYNSTFETDAYAELDVYSSAVKYSVDVVQVSSNRMDNIQMDNTERYFYLHQFDVRFFKWLKLSVMEGSLVCSPFSFRFLNPLIVMHQYGGWKDYMTAENKDIYGETNFCADFAYMLELIPIQNMRFYAIYNQIEMQLSYERGNGWGRYYPNSLGVQFGAEYSFALNDSSRLLFAAEGFYNSPYLYVKQTPSASLYRTRLDMQTKKYVNSWIGSPYGPDCAGGIFKTEYNAGKWKAELYYTFVTSGQNNFSLFSKTIKTEDGQEYYDYYPSVRYKLREKGKTKDGVTNDELYDDAISMDVSGTKQISHEVRVKGTYFINNYFELNAQIVYNYVINNMNIKNKNDSGVELDLSVTYKIF